MGIVATDYATRGGRGLRLQFVNVCSAHDLRKDKGKALNVFFVLNTPFNGCLKFIERHFLLFSSGILVISSYILSVPLPFHRDLIPSKDQILISRVGLHQNRLHCKSPL